MNTHRVIDLVYTEEEGNVEMVGTLEECNDFVSSQGSAHFTYKVEPLLTEPASDPFYKQMSDNNKKRMEEKERFEFNIMLSQRRENQRRRNGI